MKNFKTTATLSLLMIFVFAKLSVLAQTPVAPTVNVTVTISSPYSPFYSDYAGPNASKVLLIIQNLTATQKNIKLTGELQGDNGIRISTRSNYVPLQPIVLAPNETKQLNGLALKDIFDLNSLNVYGIDKVKIVQTSRLPEGNYSFCIKAVDMANNQILSASAPMGCSAISIVYPDAPVLINPMANATIPAITGQSFVWMNYLPLVGINYDFQLAEMPANVRTDPNQVLNATSRLLIQRTVVNSTSTILSPSDPPLKIGKRYAWRVIASDPTGKIVFKNKGISAANEFKYGEKPFVPSVFALNKPQVDEAIEKLNELSFKWTFTDNSSQNDNVGFYNGILRSTSNLRANPLNKYELRITKLKSTEQRHLEQKARDEKILNLTSELKKAKDNLDARKLSSINAELTVLSGTPLTIYADNGISVAVNSDSVGLKSSTAIASYVKNDSDYEWYVKDNASQVVSESRKFMLREIDKNDYKLSLAGNLRYNFRDQHIAGAAKRASQKNEVIPSGQSSSFVLTEDEKGYPLAKRKIQVLKVTFLAPVNKVDKEIKITENGVETLKRETVDRIDPLSDLAVTYSKIQKSAYTEVITTGETDETGSFNLNVPIREGQYKIIDPNVVLKGKQYALVQGLVVKVLDNRFSDPNWFVAPYEAGTVVNLGESTVQIFDYKVEANLLVDGDTWTNEGKLYVLRKEQNLVKGEVQNLGLSKKDIPMYISQTFNGPLTAPITFSSSFNVVGVSNIQSNAYSKNIPPVVFNKLVTSDNNSDDYSLYFEPSANKDALYFSPQKVSNLGGKKVSYEGTDFAVNEVVEKVTFKAKFITMKVSGRYVYNWKDKSKTKLPLPEGTVLKLVKGDMPQRSAGMDLPEFTNETLIATTTVKKNGEYSFDVGMKDYDEFNKTTGVDIAVAIVSKYYFADPVIIDRNAKKNVIMPELTAKVREFSFTSKVSYLDKSEAQYQTRIPSPMEVYLCRQIGENVPYDRPKNEGFADRNSWPKKVYELKDQYGKVLARYDIVSKTMSDTKGIFKFEGLIVPEAADENYHIFAEPISNSQENLQSIDDYTVVRTFFDAKQKLAEMRKGTFSNEQYIVNVDYSIPLTPWVQVEPMQPYIDGAVYPRSGASTTVLTKVFVEMFDMPSNIKGNLSNEEYDVQVKGKNFKTYTTGDNGRFIFENIVTKGDKIKLMGMEITAGEQPWKLLRFTKQGFIPTYYPVNAGKPLAKGQVDPNAKKIFMNLPKNIEVTVVNSDKQKIAARIIVGDDFSWMDYSPYTAASANIAKTPKGNVKFTIIPVDRTNYKTTTVYANVDLIKPDVNNISRLEFTAVKIEHTIIVKCYIKGTKTLLGANVTVLNAANFKEFAPDNYLGRGPMSVISIPTGGTQFDLRVVPKNINYTIAKTKVLSNALDIVEVEVYVEPAVSVKVKGTEVYGNFQTKPLDGDFNAYVQGFDEDEYTISKSQVVVYSPPAPTDIIVVPKTNKPIVDLVPPPPAPVTVPKTNVPTTIPKVTKPIKLPGLGSLKSENSNATYLSALPKSGITDEVEQPDGSNKSFHHNEPITEQNINEELNNNLFSETIYTITINRLPANRAFTIAGTKTNFIGNTATINPNGVNNKQVEILFWKAPDVNVNSMYGFPIELTQLYQPGANGQYRISGRLKLGAKSQFSNIQSKSADDGLEFKDILVNVNKAATGNFLTLANTLIFQQNSIDAKLFGNIEVKVIGNKDGISLWPQSSTTASIMGKVALDPSSLAKGVTTSQSGQAGNANYLYLNKKANKAATEVYKELAVVKTSNDMQTFSTAKSELAETSYFISSQSGYVPVFYGADGMAIIPDANGITFSKTQIAQLTFMGNVQTNLVNTVTKNMNIRGAFVLQSGSFTSYGTEKSTIKLKNWDLNITSWAYGTTGFNAFGNLNALGLSIPFSDLNIFKDRIGFGTFNVKELKLLNTFPIKLNASETSVSFGFDKGFSSLAGAWSVSVLANTEAAVASIKGLPDLKSTDEIKIKNISLYDTNDPNDTRILLDEKQADVTLNGVAKFRPASISGTSQMVKFRGDLSMDIPGFTGLEAVTYDLNYEIDGSTNPAKFVHVDDKPFQNLGLDTKGILVKFDGAQTFKNGKLELNGILTDKDPSGKDKYEIPVKLTKTLVNNVVSTTLLTTENKVYLNKNDKSIYLAKSDKSIYLDGAMGGTKVNATNQWDYFKLQGDLTSADAEAGVQPSPMDFEIKGEVVATKSELGIKNMGDGPLSNFSVVYDFKQNALLASGHISRNIKFAQLEIDAELKIAKAADWYIFASGKAEIEHVPMFKGVGVAFMVGNTNINDSQRATFFKHFAGNIQPSPTTLAPFNSNLSGILLMVSAEMKIPLVPTFKLDLAPIAEVEFDNGLYAATYFKLNFKGKPQIAIGGRVGAYVKLSAGASIGLACAGVSLRAEAGAELAASFNPDNGDFAAMMALKFQLEGSAYVGVGLCTSSCNTIKVLGIPSPVKCYRKQYGKVLTIGVEALLNKNGISLTGSGQTKTEN